MVADVAVFDAGTIIEATYDAPWKLSTGVHQLLVAGVPVLRNGAPTGTRPGRVPRKK